MSPLWGFGYLLYAVFYKHAAPLGLNAEPNSLPRQRWSRWGGVSVFLSVSSAQSVSSVNWTNVHMSPLWGFGCLLYVARWGGVSFFNPCPPLNPVNP